MVMVVVYYKLVIVKLNQIHTITDLYIIQEPVRIKLYDDKYFSSGTHL